MPNYPAKQITCNTLPTYKMLLLNVCWWLQCTPQQNHSTPQSLIISHCNMSMHMDAAAREVNESVVANTLHLSCIHHAGRACHCKIAQLMIYKSLQHR
jgi:hypothetical protein